MRRRYEVRRAPSVKSIDFSSRFPRSILVSAAQALDEFLAMAGGDFSGHTSRAAGSVFGLEFYFACCRHVTVMADFWRYIVCLNNNAPAIWLAKGRG